MATASPPRLPVARFWAKVDVGTVDECWLWTAIVDRHGYGRTRWDSRRYVGAHRVSWEIEHGPIPDGLCVLHHCDVPNCVNPGHLFLGTHSDNMRDMVAKGRGRTPGTPRRQIDHDYSPLPQQMHAPGEGRTHGARATYLKGCRCEPCRDAACLYMRKLRRQKRIAAGFEQR